MQIKTITVYPLISQISTDTNKKAANALVNKKAICAFTAENDIFKNSIRCNIFSISR